MIYTNEIIYNKLLEIEKRLVKLEKEEIENSIEELSLNKVRKSLHCSENKIKKLVKQKKLPARIEDDGRYKFRVTDIIKFQNRELYANKEEVSLANTISNDDLQEKFFGYRTKHRRASNE